MENQRYVTIYGPKLFPSDLLPWSLIREIGRKVADLIKKLRSEGYHLVYLSGLGLGADLECAKLCQSYLVPTNSYGIFPGQSNIWTPEFRRDFKLVVQGSQKTSFLGREFYPGIYQDHARHLLDKIGQNNGVSIILKRGKVTECQMIMMRGENLMRIEILKPRELTGIECSFRHSLS